MTDPIELVEDAMAVTNADGAAIAFIPAPDVILTALTEDGWRIVRFDPTTVEQGPLIITDEWTPQ